MIDKFLAYISKQKLSTIEDKLLLAVSGGIDSVVLAHLFSKTAYDIGVAHCNFKLRDSESDEDEIFVKLLADSINACFYVKHFDTKKYAINNQLSVQMAARELRYQWFEQLREEKGYDYIVTAHHLNDNIETVIFNLTKGTGISGLRGILPKKGYYIRPLLFASRHEIEEYASKNDLQWREDSSNISLKYKRNVIRHKVIPVLKKINPNLESTFFTSMDRILGAEQLVKNVAAHVNSSITKKNGDLYIPFDELYEHNLAIIEEILKPYGFRYPQTLHIAESIASDHVGAIFYSDGFQLNIDRGHMIISIQTEDNPPLEILENATSVQNSHVRLSFSKSDIKQGISTDKWQASIDFEKLTFPLQLRKWQQGDSFYPLGMRHKKKISDFMIDEKIPLNLKERLYVITSEGDIVWVVGHRLDDRFKVQSGTRQLFNIILDHQ